MSFFIKHYFSRISDHSFWLLLILIGPVAYIVMSTLIDRFSASQDITMSEDSFVVVPSSSPGKPKMEQLREIIAKPDSFFQDRSALFELYSELYPGVPAEQRKRKSLSIEETIKECIYLTMPSENIVRVNYQGKDRRIGEILVKYYSLRLANKAREGRKNVSNRPELSSKWTGNINLSGGMKVTTHHTIWRANRLAPLLWILLISTLVILLLYLIFEVVDPSFNSEREVARYLGLPILGSLPKLDDIIKSKI
jgi:hypothetical protein